MSDTAFRIALPPELRADLRARLERTRWSDALLSDWSDGTDAATLRELVRIWRDAYDFDAACERLNAMPQSRVEIDGFGLHVVRLRGTGPDPVPLLLLNGWPSSFVEYRRLAPMLADPAAFGRPGARSFDVIMPALPGFGFSDRPIRLGQVWAEDLFDALMVRHLGQASYVVAGTDIGAGVARRLALAHPDRVRGIHVSAVADLPLAADAPPLAPAERAYQASVAAWHAHQGAYLHLQATNPQTLAFALADSPVGLASWIVQKFHAWSDHGGDLLRTFPAEMLLDTLMVYWASGSIGASMRSYLEHAQARPAALATDRVRVPTAICMWPKDLVVAPRAWAERGYDVTRYVLQPRGGHFPAWEAPEAYAADIAAFEASLAP